MSSDHHLCWTKYIVYISRELWCVLSSVDPVACCMSNDQLRSGHQRSASGLAGWSRNCARCSVPGRLGPFLCLCRVAWRPWGPSSLGVSAPPLQNITYVEGFWGTYFVAQRILGEWTFGSLHKFHVVHCALRKFHLENLVLVCNWWGWPLHRRVPGEIISVSLHKLYIVRSRPLHKQFSANYLCNNFGAGGGGCTLWAKHIPSVQLRRQFSISWASDWRNFRRFPLEPFFETL